MNASDIPDALEAIKRQQRLTTEGLAELFDVDRSTVWRWIRRTSLPSRRKQELIQSYLRLGEAKRRA